MRFTLKGYQTEAVEGVLERLVWAKDDTRKGRRVSFALSAVTGAGKTVMATAVFEALFNGSDEFDAAPDSSAVVLWVTDDPSLNEQTRYRIHEASDRLDLNQLRIIGNGGFDQETFEPQTVYFLNIQKLGTATTWVKHSDKRTYTLWDTIRNTIEDNRLTLYLVLDEAHRGMRSPQSRSNEETTRSTIVQRLVNGHDDVPPAPIVWGISATIERFRDAMHAAENRTTYDPVAVDPRDVQASGLLKDVITLDFPDEQGTYDTTMLRSSIREVRELSRLWADYAVQEGMSDPILPLMVLQVPNKPKDADLLAWLEIIHIEWPELGDDAIANVFGEHTTLELGPYTVAYVAPQDVQDSTYIRVLLAKDAISTGWDCPRAEVLFSLRPAKDRTHITQLLGRMIRTPLARRVESDERLSAVRCFLPEFDRKTATDVAEVLTGLKIDADDPDSRANEGLGRKALTSPLTMAWNVDVPEAIGDFLTALPSETAPKSDMKPIKRLLGLVAEIAVDGLKATPDDAAREALYGVLDGQMAQHQYTVNEGVEDIQTAEIRSLSRSIGGETVRETIRQVQADDRTVEDAFRRASRAIGSALAIGYVKRLVSRADDTDQVDLYEAKARVAALLNLPGVVDVVETVAEDLANTWLDQLRREIGGLNEERQAQYDEIRRRAREPQRIDIVAPKSRIENTKDVEGNLLPTRPKHLLADEYGEYPVGSLNDWELQVVDAELRSDTTIAWYRNPSRPSKDALQVPYRMGNAWKPMQPDFIFFSQKQDGTYAASIVDPHGDYLADALPKLNGLADFAETYGDELIRIEAVAKVGDELRMLDLTNPDVRMMVRSASDAKDVYRSDVAVKYE